MENAINVEMEPVTRARFWRTWFGWNALGYFISILPTMILNYLSDKGLLSFPAWTSLKILGVPLQTWVYVAVILVEALSIAWVQRRVLQGTLKNYRLWFLVTFVAFIAFNLLNGGTYIGMINNLSSTTGTSGYENRQFEYTLLSYLSAFSGGLLFGLTQWLVLRLEVGRAWRWLVWAAGGWLVYVVITNLGFPALNTAIQGTPSLASLASSANLPYYRIVLQLIGYVLYLAFPAISGVGLAGMLARAQPRQAEQAVRGKPVTVGNRPKPASESAQAVAETAEDSRRKFLLVRLVIVTVLALVVSRMAYALGLNDVIAGWLAPLVGSQQDTSLISALLYSVFAGVLIGLSQVWVLGPGYRRRWIWVLATAIGFIFETLNAQNPIGLISDWAQKGLSQSPTLLFAFAGQVATSAGFWLALGLIQAAALWQWTGRRAWAWVLLVPVVQATALLGRLVFGFPVEAALVGLASGAALLFFLRSGWKHELAFVPQSDHAVVPEDLQQALQVLEDRLVEFNFGRAQVSIEDDLLVVSYDDATETDFITDMAQQQGNAAFFEVAQPVERDEPLPDGANVLLTEEDIDSIQAIRSGEDRQPYLRVKFSETGFARLSEFWKAHPGFTIGLALDGQVLTTFAVTEPQAEAFLVEGLDPADADFVAGVLNNDPLPFRLELVEVEGADEKEPDTASVGA